MKLKTKKILITVLSVLMVISAALMISCSPKNGDSGDVPPTPPTPPTTTHTHEYSVSWDIVDDKATPTVTCLATDCDGNQQADFIKEYTVSLTTKITTFPTVSTNGERSYNISATNGDKTITATVKKPVTLPDPIDLTSEVVKEYLSAKTSAEQFNVLKNKGDENKVVSGDKPKGYTITIKKGSAKSLSYFHLYDITTDTSLSKELMQTMTIPHTVNKTVLYNGYEHGHIYYYCLTNQDKTETYYDNLLYFDSEFTVRYVNIDGVANFRDLGGWTMSNGEPIPYGLIYRSSSLDNIGDKGREKIKELGIKTLIDLRHSTDGEPAKNPKLEGVKYYCYHTQAQYESVINSSLNGNLKDSGVAAEDTYLGTKCVTQKDAYKDIFSILADEKNYPVVFNCVSGADRTGTLAALIEGLLGVSEEDIVKDFELTSFASKGSTWGRWRAGANKDNNDFLIGSNKAHGSWDITWTPFMNAVKNIQTKGTIQSNIEYYLINKVGLTAKTVNDIKSIFGCVIK